MSTDLIIEVEKRETFGKNESRRLRRLNKIPAILYGGGGGPIPLMVDPKIVEAILFSELGGNALFGISISGGVLPGKCMIKDPQVDPVSDRLVHTDFLRIAMDKEVRVHVAVHTVGIARGVKLEGGILEHPLREVELECLPGRIPERIDIDISDLGLGQNIRVRDLKVESDIKVISDLNMPVVSVVAPTVEKVEETAVEGAEAGTEPEVLKKGKEPSDKDEPSGQPVKDTGGKAEKS